MSWARDSLGTLEPGEAAAAVRVRTEPNPWPRTALARVDWTSAERTTDALVSALETRLAEVGAELPPCRVRLEVLDGAGTAIPGMGANCRFEGAPTVSTATGSGSASTTTTSAQAPNRAVMDAEFEPAQLPAVPERHGRALAVARAYGGDATVEVPVSALVAMPMFILEEVMADNRHLRGYTLALGHQIREMAQVARHGWAGAQEHAEGMLAIALEATERGSRADAGIELEREKAKGQTVEKPPVAQVVDAIQAASGAMKARSDGIVAVMQAKAALGGAGGQGPTPTPTPAPTPAPNAEPSMADLLLDPNVSEELIAGLVDSPLNPHRDRIVRIAQNIAAARAKEKQA